MKLKEGFILHQTGDVYFAVASGEASEAFQGFIQNNKTANFIYQQLLIETTETEIIEAMLAKYNAPREVIKQDVKELLAQLKEAGILDE